MSREHLYLSHHGVLMCSVYSFVLMHCERWQTFMLLPVFEHQHNLGRFLSPVKCIYYPSPFSSSVAKTAVSSKRLHLSVILKFKKARLMYQCYEAFTLKMSRDMRFPSMWYMRPAKAQTSLLTRASASRLNII